MKWKPDVCIHHHPCSDGFMAALIVRRRWPECQMVGMNYGQRPAWDFPTGQNVLIVDFSMSLEQIATMNAETVIILDHHKTAQAMLKDITVEPWTFGADEVPPMLMDKPIAHFDMTKSGAVLAWEFCFPGAALPHLLKFIQDRDLWTKVYPDSDAVHLLLSSFGFEGDLWLKLMDEFQVTNTLQGHLQSANAIKRYYDNLVFECATRAKVGRFAGWENVPVAYVIPQLASDVGHTLLQMHEGAPFAVLVSKSDDGTSYSLRSDNRRQDVSEVARTFGGGGHRNAAGFRAP